jgi:inosine-uridine nucleoside N-ribohydrolase
MERAWGGKYLPYLHDPLVIASLLWNNLLTFKRENVIIELQGNVTRGATVKDHHGVAINVAADVNSKLFINRLLDRICI